MHIRDVASLFRLALEKGPAGRYWHAVQDEGIPFRDIAEAIGSRLDLPAVSIPMDVLMLPGYFGQFTNLVTGSFPATSLITRQTLGWEPTAAQPVRRSGQRPLLPGPLTAEAHRPNLTHSTTHIREE